MKNTSPRIFEKHKYLELKGKLKVQMTNEYKEEKQYIFLKSMGIMKVYLGC